MDYYKIRYSICTFKIKLNQNSKLNSYKVSGIRGIIGQELMKRNCISDKDCGNCSFSSNCIPFNFYNMEIKNNISFLASNRVPPYIIICDDRREIINKGEEIIFQIIFFSNSIGLIPEVIRAVYNAGYDFGLYNNKFILEDVSNDCNKYIFKDNEFNLNNINYRFVSDYINNRLNISKETNYIKIVNSLRYKKNGKLAKDIDSKDLLDLLIRRITTLNALEGNDVTISNDFSIKIIEKNLKWQENERYSNKQKSKMKLGGLVGTILIDANDINTKKLLIAGELVHIGKSTSFGLGDYFLY